MIFKQNLHTHTTYCDGKDTPEEMILAAIEKGFDSIGFSGHSYMHYAPSHSMSLEGTEEYIRDVRRLKEKYADKIKVYLGLEFDMFSEGIDFSQYEYLIGSMHYFRIGDEYVGFDRSQAEVQRVINTYFGGDGMKYAKSYYEALASLPSYCKSDILGHFDLITKHSENICFFDTQSKEYRNAVTECIEALSGKIAFFEVNTGAVARGYRTTPYTDEFILKTFKEFGFGALISSDCHDKNMLDCAFDQSRELLLSCGFKEVFILTDSGFEAVAL